MREGLLERGEDKKKKNPKQPKDGSKRQGDGKTYFGDGAETARNAKYLGTIWLPSTVP